MKKLILAISICTVATTFSVTTLAQPSQGAAMQVQGQPAQGKQGGKHPCHKIKEACKAAGFVRGGTTGKEIFKDCMKPLMAGTAVSGVNVLPADLQACQAKMSARKAAGGGAEKTAEPMK